MVCCFQTMTCPGDMRGRGGTMILMFSHFTCIVFSKHTQPPMHIHSCTPPSTPTPTPTHPHTPMHNHPFTPTHTHPPTHIHPHTHAHIHTHVHTQNDNHPTTLFFLFSLQAKLISRVPVHLVLHSTANQCVAIFWKRRHSYHHTRASLWLLQICRYHYGWQKSLWPSARGKLQLLPAAMDSNPVSGWGNQPWSIQRNRVNQPIWSFI